MTLCFNLSIFLLYTYYRINQQQSSMDLFEAKLRGSHAKAVENIMSRTTGFVKLEPRQKAMKPKGENISTYLRKFQIDRQNLNLAKRILLCESQHNHKLYEREWKKTENFMRVRSNFKRGLSNQQPRIFKFQPITGKGNCLITFRFNRFQSNPIHFRPDNLYSLRVMVAHTSVNPTNYCFKLSSLGTSPMSFYVPFSMRRKNIVCKVAEVKENQMYDKGKMTINLGQNENQQQVILVSKQGKQIATVWVKVEKELKLTRKKRSQVLSNFIDKNEYEENQTI